MSDITAVRLAGGLTRSSGRVELQVNGQWVTVCDLFWDNLAASALCKQLGYDSGTSHFAAAFGQGRGTVWLAHFACKGHETKLQQCPRMRFGDHACLHDQDSGAVCIKHQSRFATI